MSFPFLPYMVTDQVTDLTPALLKAHGIQLLMLDFDNTIVPYTSNTPSGEMQTWLETMLKSDIRLCVVSNSHNDRVRKFCDAYGLPCITHARKPSTGGIRRCLDQYGVAPAQAALAGDQIYTDTLGAGLAGVKAILVKAIHNHNFWLKARHVLEMPFILMARNRRLEK